MYGIYKIRPSVMCSCSGFEKMKLPGLKPGVFWWVFIKTPCFKKTGRFRMSKTYLLSRDSNTPAATALPITPATFGPMACISR